MIIAATVAAALRPDVAVNSLLPVETPFSSQLDGSIAEHGGPRSSMPM